MRESQTSNILPLIVVQALFFVTLFAICTTQRADFIVPENIQNRRFSLSTEAPLTRAINELAPGAIPHIDLLNRHVTRVEEAILKSLRRDRLIPEAAVQPCNPLIDIRYRRSMDRIFAVRGFPEPAWNCGSDISGVAVEQGENLGYTLEDLYRAAFNRGARVKERVGAIAKRLIDNFTRPEVPFNFTYSTVSAECVLTPVCMTRVGSHWHQEIGIHSHGREDHVKDGSRNSILEFFRVVDGVLGDNLFFRLPRYDDGTVERVFVENSTTMIQTWNGTPNPSCFRLVPIEDNPALIEALDRVNHSAQQAEDAVSSSNLAILLLPLGLNLIPVALFADVGTTTMFLYMILSDMLPVIPLAIKGLELVIIRSLRFRSVITRVLSPGFRNYTKPFAAGGEIWAAECRVREEVGRTGVVLIVVSVVFLFIGVIGELAGRWFVQRRFGNESHHRRSRSGTWSWSGSRSWSREEDSLSWKEVHVDDYVGAIGADERYSESDEPP